MGLLRRAIMLIAATVIFASPSAAKVVKFEVLKVLSSAEGTLVPSSIDSVGFPLVPGIAYPSPFAQPTVIRCDEVPPSKGASYPVFAPRTDAGGGDIAGIHLPTPEPPAATHPAWNLRKAGFSQGGSAAGA